MSTGYKERLIDQTLSRPNAFRPKDTEKYFYLSQKDKTTRKGIIAIIKTIKIIKMVLFTTFLNKLECLPLAETRN